MKALKLLKILRDDYIHGELDKDINEAINELEEAMKPKTCEGCKQSWEPNNQTFHKYFCEYLKIPIHSNFCCNRHEPKDNQ
jgi:hypothetical protein